MYDLSEHCEFGACKEENIRDRIVVGIRNKDLSRRLQLMKDLTLAQMNQIVRQSEEVAAQVSLIQEVRDKRKSMERISQQQQHGRLPAEKKWAGSDKKCGKCGKTTCQGREVLGSKICLPWLQRNGTPG